MTLWDRGGADAAVEQHVAVSAWAFPQPINWDQVQARLNTEERTSIGPVSSAMHVFETWISAGDRKGEHILVELRDGGRPPAFAFIDYAYSMSQVWGGPDAQTGAVQSVLPAGRDQGALETMAEAIASIKNEVIDEIVTQIPVSFLPVDKRGTILNNLIGRKCGIRGLVGL